jgi:hypothetical protein
MFIRLLSTLLCVLAPLFAPPASATDPEALLATWARAANAESPGFSGFSPERGRAFYMKVHTTANGEHACVHCHSADPRQIVEGHTGAIRADCAACHPGSTGMKSDRSRIRRDIKPLAPSANPARFTDSDKVTLWFDVNCFYVVGRACTATEKGDILTWLLSVK